MVFQIPAKEWENGNFAWRNCNHSMLFSELVIKFSTHRLITISMIYMYIKPEFRRNERIVLSRSIHKAYIG